MFDSRILFTFFSNNFKLASSNLSQLFQPIAHFLSYSFFKYLQCYIWKKNNKI